MTHLVKASSINVWFNNQQVLQDINLQIEESEIVTIVGPNGSGKSTLLRVLIGAQHPDSGQVWRQPGLKIGYVPQKIFVDQTLPITVRGFLSLPHKQSRKNVMQALAQTDTQPLADMQLAALSGGQLQRVLLARALLDQPGLLILDEPTQGLDQAGAASFYQLIEQVRDSADCAVLLVSHELHVVMSATDRVVCLNRHVCCHGTPDIVRERPEYRALFGSGTGGALALYRHEHDHTHSHHPADHQH